MANFTLDPEEQIVRHIYHHWIELAATATMAGILITVALAMLVGYPFYTDIVPAVINFAIISVFAFIMIAMAVAILVFGVWTYRRNYMVLTTKHLIQAEQHGLFTSQVDQVSLGRIQDVTGRKSGVLSTIFGFGTLSVQSAGEARQFVFHHVPDPQGLADYILSAHEKFLKDHGQGPAD